MSSIEQPEPLRVCIGCLATDGRLYDIREKCLEQAYTELTGLADASGLLCTICRHLMRKFHEFHNRCLNAAQILKNLHPLSEEMLTVIDRTHFKSNLMTTKTLLICSDYNLDKLQKLSVSRTHVIGYDAAEKENKSDITLDFDDKVKKTHSVKTRKTTKTGKGKKTNAPVENMPQSETTYFLSVKCESPVKDEFLEDEIDAEISNNDNDSDYDIDMTNPIDDSSNIEVEKTNPDKTETHSHKPNGKKTTRKKIKSKTIDSNFSDIDDVSSTSSLDGIEDIKVIKFKGKRKYKLRREEKHIIYELTNLFKIMREKVKKSKGDFYKLFEKMYRESLNVETPFNKADCKIPNKHRSESQNIVHFINLYKQSAHLYNIDIEFISIEQERRAMDERRRGATEEQCKLCCRRIVSVATYDRHVKKWHDESQPFKCLVCLYTFKDQNRYIYHLLKVHAMRKTCKECGHSIVPSSASLRGHWPEVNEHRKTHRAPLTHCEFCGRSFTLPKYYYLHVRSAHRSQMNSVQCLLCGDSYKGTAGLTHHMHKIHAEAVKCASCSVWFVDGATMDKHTDNGQCRKELSGCPLCGATFPTEPLMREHYDHAHAVYKCTKCAVSFIAYKSYRQHCYKICRGELTKLSRETAKCEPDDARRVPAKKYKYLQQLRKEKNEVKLYICDVCGKEYVVPAHLVYHQRIHTGEKPFKCDHCGKTFRLKQSLRVHMRTHTDERKYKCKLCTKTFRQHSHLYAHMPSHTHEKKHGCSMCAKRFTSGYTLRYHVRTAHEGLSPIRRKRQKKGAHDTHF